jgi:CheY-like chemotaxis protein
VRDTGPGLDAEQLSQLFQPFNRLGQESGELEGTGIGLVMSKRVVEQMGGTLGVESEAGVGSVFWFELASADAVAGAAENAPSAASSPAHPLQYVAMRTLLYVEDNPANLKLVELLLGRRPELRLLSAVNGRDGVELARVHQPDAILMDINLPGISGFEALAILREDPLTAHIPVIALSANAMQRTIQQGLQAGFFRYLTKPIKVDEFMAVVDAALELAQSAAAERSNSVPSIPGKTA